MFLRISLNFFLLFLVGALDLVTGNEVHLGTFYLLVVAIASWNLPRWALFLHAAATVTVWSAMERLTGVHYSIEWHFYWNIGNHVGVVMIIAGTIFNVKTVLDRQQRLILELGQSLLNTSRFKELVPVCRLCHEVHIGDEYKTTVDEVMQEGIELETIGNVCPGCLSARMAHVDRVSVASYF